MNILFIRSTNPYTESSASANRYTALINGLISQGCSVTLIVTGGFWSCFEYKARKSSISKQLNIKYSIPAFNNNLFLYRINKYILSGFWNFVSGLFLRRFIKSSDFDFIWVTFNESILSIFLKYKELVRCKSIIELNEYNDIYKSESHISSQLQYKKADQENEVFLKAIKKNRFVSGDDKNAY